MQPRHASCLGARHYRHYKGAYMKNKFIMIKDYPCGSGKTSKMIEGLSYDKKYLIVVPLLSEVERIIERTHIQFYQPNGKECSKQRTKYESLETLLLEGKNIVTTHQLYSAIVSLAREGLMSDYHVIIDEVPNVCTSIRTKHKRSLKEFYIGNGYIEVDDQGKVFATEKWDRDHEDVSDTLDEKLYQFSKSGFLYLLDETLFVWVLPTELLTLTFSMTILTYKSEGSLLLPFLKKSGIKAVVMSDQKMEEEFRIEAKRLITLRSIPKLEKFNFSHTGQNKILGKTNTQMQVASALKSLRYGDLKDVNLKDVLITCAKSQWLKGDDNKPRPAGFSKGARLFEANWVANTTRGTNDYAHCSHLIYLYDQFINPYIGRWLEAGTAEMCDAYALTELIQWVWRSRVRKGEAITLYIPSTRMRRLFGEWLNTPIATSSSRASLAA